jgi:hypothetical protein
VDGNDDGNDGDGKWMMDDGRWPWWWW